MTGMSARQKGLAVLAIQLALVLSIGAKYEWERHHFPMVWARSQQYDPSQPLRGRYLTISVYASACGLQDPAAHGPRAGVNRPDIVQNDADRPELAQTLVLIENVQIWHVVPAVRNGELAPQVVGDTRPGPTQVLTLDRGTPCQYARLSGTSDYFIPEHAKSPLPLQKGQELWALVTVPPSGPVRPVKLAISDSTGFHVLNLD
jgi:hypothetical protein